jgi:hypothetical protein
MTTETQQVQTCRCGETRRCVMCQPSMFQASEKWQAYFAARALVREPEAERIQHFQERRAAALNSWDYQDSRHQRRASFVR